MIPVDTVGVMVNNRHLLIRHMEPLEAKRQLLIKLPQLSRSYGAYEAVPDYVYEEVLRLLTSKFSHLSIADIEEAYRLSASGHIDNAEAKIYAGVFNAKNIAALLRDYSSKRQAILLSLETNIQQQKEDENKQMNKESFEKNFLTILSKYANTCKTYDDVPSHLYGAAIRLGYYDENTSDALLVKRNAWERSKSLATTELEKEANDLHLSGRHYEAKQLFNPDRTESRRIMIAQKLIVFERVLPKFKTTTNDTIASN